MVYSDVELQSALEQALHFGRKKAKDGRVADYIPELRRSDPHHLGIVLIRQDGREFFAGNTGTPFTLQSVSKVVTLNLALDLFGMEEVFQRVGMEPTDDPFNSIVHLEMSEPKKPLNPMINSGAIAVCGLLVEKLGKSRSLQQLIDFTTSKCISNGVRVNEAVFKSEISTGHRNWAFAHLLREIEIINCSPEDALELYLQACALEVTCSDLAHLGVYYSRSRNEIANEKKADINRVINSLLITCGMYNESGKFAVQVGIPAKSGVSGAIMAIVPGRIGIGVYGPSLDKKGNSIGGIELLAHLSRKLELSLF